MYVFLGAYCALLWFCHKSIEERDACRREIERLKRRLSEWETDAHWMAREDTRLPKDWRA